jgi:hypothetical protein
LTPCAVTPASIVHLIEQRMQRERFRFPSFGLIAG